MNEGMKTPDDRDALLERLVADLTVAAYRIALRSRARGTPALALPVAVGFPPFE
jgi:hypothetical protein